ncbi:MAG: hypothetical protein J5800_05420 [Spirochaetales bacterium]|nr:hypothetical protein [Spirochaetales bacterium]MBR4426845.1 hypothetical protein [Spirochaetales bacterium]
MKNWMNIVTTIVGWIVSVVTILWKISRDKKADAENRRKEEEERNKTFKEFIEQLSKQNAENYASIQKQLDKALPALQHTFESSIQELKLEFEKRLQEIVKEQDDKRIHDNGEIDKRIQSLEQKFATEVMASLGRLEGVVSAKFETFENTLNLLQRHFIEN